MQILRPAWFSSHSSSSSYFQMHPGFFKFYTTRLNPIFAWFARSNRALMKIWFSLGALFGFVAMLGSVIGLMLNLYWSLSKPTAKEQLLTPIVCMDYNQIYYHKINFIFPVARSEYSTITTGLLLFSLADCWHTS